MATSKGDKQRKHTRRGARVLPKRAIRVIPTRRKRIDPDMIALTYWMIAKRMAEERDGSEKDKLAPQVKSDRARQVGTQTLSPINEITQGDTKPSDELLRRSGELIYNRSMSNTDATDTNYHGVLLEEIQRQVVRMSEAMADVPGKVTNIDERLARVESNVAVIKAVVTEQSKQLDDHQTEIARLRAAA